jgi:hypothetical protein
MGPIHWIHGWDLSLGQLTRDGRFDGETFLGGLLIFSLGGRGRGKGTPGHDCRDVFAGRHEFQTVLFMLYIIYCAVEVSLQHAPPILDDLGRHV